MFKKAIEHLRSEEGQADVKRYFEAIQVKEDMVQSQVDRFWKKYSEIEAFDEIVERIKIKYESSVYRNREYDKCGREPNEDLYSFLFSVAKKYGNEIDVDDENPFEVEARELNGWVFRLYQGQGCVIHIERIRSKDRIKKYLGYRIKQRKFSANVIVGYWKEKEKEKEEIVFMTALNKKDGDYFMQKIFNSIENNF